MVEANFVDLEIDIVVAADSMDLGIVEVEPILTVAALQLMDHTEVQLEVHRQEVHH